MGEPYELTGVPEVRTVPNVVKLLFGVAAGTLIFTALSSALTGNMDLIFIGAAYSTMLLGFALREGLVPLLARARHHAARRRIRRAVLRGDPMAITGRVQQIFEDRSLLVDTNGKSVYVHAAWSQPTGSPPLELRVGDLISVEGPNADDTPMAIGGAATFRDAPRLRVFAPEPEGAVYVVRDGEGQVHERTVG
ncbi:MAG: hypothetical protein JRH11_14910 [Deltaproteobacteria bacterium]|nr:hypothetical protein [Deltaproteobacteria bacterium]